jgi:hypothetical protein
LKLIQFFSAPPVQIGSAGYKTNGRPGFESHPDMRAMHDKAFFFFFSRPEHRGRKSFFLQRVDPPSFDVVTSSRSALIELLLDTVVTTKAERLPIAPIPEQRIPVTVVGPDMVHHTRRFGTASIRAHAA